MYIECLGQLAGFPPVTCPVGESVTFPNNSPVHSNLRNTKNIKIKSGYASPNEVIFGLPACGRYTLYVLET
jgi:hypothetical protein